jgi:hypothetical protein
MYCFLWSTNWIYICYVEESRLPLWPSGQSSWLQSGDVLCFLWGTSMNTIYICSVKESGPPVWPSGQSSWLHNGDVLCFLWGTNWIYICYVEESRLPLWSSCQSCWLQIQRSGFDTRRYQIFREAVGLERGSFCLVSTIKELLGRNSSGSGLEIQDYDRRGIRRADRTILSIRKRCRRSLGRYSSLVDSGHGVCFCLYIWMALGLCWLHGTLYSYRLHHFRGLFANSGQYSIK